MIHVATVHWRDGSWIDLQLNALKKHSSEPFRTYAFLNHLPENSLKSHIGKFDYVSCEDIANHEIKLNLLADMISFAAEDPDDLLVFLDGDAFPIDDYAAFAREHLPDRKLIAVRRDENIGDQQPHPCFCVTTVGFWREIHGTWHKGYKWKNNDGHIVSDVGGNLLGILRERGIDWMDLLRSNRKNLHPIFFAIYGDLVYHHGAAFRTKKARITNDEIRKQVALHPITWILNAFPESKIKDKLRARFDPYMKRRVKHSEEMARLSSEIFNYLKADPEWYRGLL